MARAAPHRDLKRERPASDLQDNTDDQKGRCCHLLPASRRAGHELTDACRRERLRVMSTRALLSTGMTHPETLHVTVRGGDHDGETFDVEAADAGAGDTITYRDGHYRLIQVKGQEWIARLVRGDVDS